MKKLLIISAFCVTITGSLFPISWESTIGQVTGALKVAPAALDLGSTAVSSGGKIAGRIFQVATEIKSLDQQLGITQGRRNSPEEIRNALPTIFTVLTALSAITFELALIFEKTGGVAEAINKNVGGQIAKAGIVLRESLEIMNKIMNTVNNQMPEIIERSDVNQPKNTGIVPPQAYQDIQNRNLINIPM